jgi:hypothetical protein
MVFQARMPAEILVVAPTPTTAMPRMQRRLTAVGTFSRPIIARLCSRSRHSDGITVRSNPQRTSAKNPQIADEVLVLFTVSASVAAQSTCL